MPCRCPAVASLPSCRPMPWADTSRPMPCSRCLADALRPFPAGYSTCNGLADPAGASDCEGFSRSLLIVGPLTRRKFHSGRFNRERIRLWPNFWRTGGRSDSHATQNKSEFLSRNNLTAGRLLLAADPGQVGGTGGWFLAASGRLGGHPGNRSGQPASILATGKAAGWGRHGWPILVAGVGSGGWRRSRQLARGHGWPGVDS